MACKMIMTARLFINVHKKTKQKNSLDLLSFTMRNVTE